MPRGPFGDRSLFRQPQSLSMSRCCPRWGVIEQSRRSDDGTDGGSAWGNNAFGGGMGGRACMLISFPRRGGAGQVDCVPGQLKRCLRAGPEISAKKAFLPPVSQPCTPALYRVFVPPLIVHPQLRAQRPARADLLRTAHSPPSTGRRTILPEAARRSPPGMMIAARSRPAQSVRTHPHPLRAACTHLHRRSVQFAQRDRPTTSDCLPEAHTRAARRRPLVEREVTAQPRQEVSLRAGHGRAVDVLGGWLRAAYGIR